MSSTGTSFEETENVPGIVRLLVLKLSSLLCRLSFRSLSYFKLVVLGANDLE